MSASGKRLPSETFRAYRKRLAKESVAHKRLLTRSGRVKVGRYLYQSTITSEIPSLDPSMPPQTSIRSTGPARQVGTRTKPKYESLMPNYKSWWKAGR